MVAMSSAEDLLISKWREAVRSPEAFLPETCEARDLPNVKLVHCPAYSRPTNVLDIPSVFESYNEEEANFSLPGGPALVCWIDLLNETVIEDSMDLVEEFKEGCNEDLTEAPHPLVLPESPIAQGHFLFLLYKDEGLPQAVSPEFLTLVLNIFRVLENDSMRLGYDSLGAGACYNHLHFHVLLLDQMPGSPVFPIENCERKLLLSSSLQHKRPNEIDMFSQGIQLSELRHPHLFCLVVSPLSPVTPANISEITESVGNVAGTIVNHLIERNFPHNLMITGHGTVVYIFVRLQGPHVTYVELSGLVMVERAEGLQQGEREVEGLLESVKANQGDFEEVRGYIVSHLKSIYKSG
jgi:hypothetical protein